MMITNNKKVVKNMTEKVYQLVFSAVLLENRFPFFFPFAFGRAQMDFESTLIVHDPTLSRCIRVHFLCF